MAVVVGWTAYRLSLMCYISLEKKHLSFPSLKGTVEKLPAAETTVVGLTVSSFSKGPLRGGIFNFFKITDAVLNMGK